MNRYCRAIILPFIVILASCGNGERVPTCDWYVNAAMGNNNNAGTPGAPFKTITYALTRTKSGEVVCAAPGTYNAVSGETFPIVVPANVALRSLEGRAGTVVEGGGTYSLAFGTVKLGFYASDQSTIDGFTIKVPSADVVGIDVGIATESGAAVLKNNAFVGIAMGHEGGAAIATGGSAAPLIADNTMTGCHDGIGSFGASAPVIRRNIMTLNEDQAVDAQENAVPDLGTPADPGRNTIKDNGSRGLFNETADSIIQAAGNTWNVNCTTDASGHYTTQLIKGAYDNATACPGELSNFRIENEGASIQL